MELIIHTIIIMNMHLDKVVENLSLDIIHLDIFGGVVFKLTVFRVIFKGIPYNIKHKFNKKGLFFF